MDLETIIASLVLTGALAEHLTADELAVALAEVERLVEHGRAVELADEMDGQVAAIRSAAEAALIELRAAAAKSLN